MNQREKKYIKDNLKQIFVVDQLSENDMQTEHTIEFLMDLATMVGFDLHEEELKYESGQ